MSTPEQPRHDDQDRPAGGVRGAINDLLGRGEHPGDDRRVEDERLAAEGRGSTHDAGPGQQPPAPTGARFEGQPVEQPRGEDTAGAGPRPHGTRDHRPDDLFDDAPGSARHGDSEPGHSEPGHGEPGYGDPAARSGPGLSDPARPGPAHTGTPRHDPAQHDPAQHDPAQHDPARPGSQRPDPGHPGATGDAPATTRLPATGPDTAAPTGPRAGRVADTSRGEDAEGRERLVSTDRASSYASRWDAVKGEFVDEPRKAVADADALVGELLDELQALFTEQRRGIEEGLASDETSTEDMRLALRRYRSFFDRLLTI